MIRRTALPLTMSLAVTVSAQAQDVATRFTRDPALFEAKQQQIVDLMRRQSPEAAAELEKVFAQDVLAVLAPELKRMGLDSQDTADMTAAYWVLAWEASHGIAGTPTAPAVMQGARRQIAGTMRENPGIARMSERERQDVGDTMLLQALLVDLRMRSAARQGAEAQRKMSDAIYAEATQTLKTDLRKVALSANGFSAEPAAATGPAAPAAAGPSPAANTVPSAYPENWKAVEGVYFRAYTGFGVGGMVTVDYEPLVLFRDGSYYEVEGPALEDVDLAASRRAKPRAWGRWTKTATGFALTDDKGKTSEEKLQGGRFFKAFAAEAAGNKLQGTFSRVSGGGNSALGGEMTIAAQTDLTFAADGRFMRKSGGGGFSSGATTGVSTAAYSRNRPTAGRYRISNFTITLTQPDGQSERKFFAFGSKKTPPQLASDMAFIGDRVFVVMD